ncbi:tail fiber domain-containing protein [Yoonia sp. 208BN28-4]|uniref:tail fiber domain-containing protein n=1 Tax=Yoonia sp. 208BN28-4 TaxID=3126505 RepID=UPI0030ADEB9E
MAYDTGTITISGDTVTGTGTGWNSDDIVRAGDEIVVYTDPGDVPVQFLIASRNGSTELTLARAYGGAAITDRPYYIRQTSVQPRQAALLDAVSGMKSTFEGYADFSRRTDNPNAVTATQVGAQPTHNPAFTGELSIGGLTHADLQGAVSLMSQGVSLSVAQTPAGRAQAIQAALTALTARGKAIYLPRGEYLIDAQISVPSGAKIFGDGPRHTVIKLVSADAAQNVFDIRGVQDVIVQGLTGDGNVQRFAVRSGSVQFTAGVLAAGQEVAYSVPCAGVTAASTALVAWSDDLPDGVVLQKTAGVDVIDVVMVNTLESKVSHGAGTISVCETDYSVASNTVGCVFGIANSARVLINDVAGKHACKHVLDVAAGLYYNAVPATTKAGYPDGASSHITVANSTFWGGGDDNVTTHGSEFIWFSGVYSHSANGTLVPLNSNAFEIDDSSRYIWLSDVHASNCIPGNGIEIKGHSTSPAANHVFLRGAVVDYCGVGIDLHHTAHGGSGQPQSPTASHVQIDGAFIRNCKDQYVRVLSYANVHLTSLYLQDDGRCANDKPFAIENGARGVTLDRFETAGFTSRILNGLFLQDPDTSNIVVQNGVITGGRGAGVYTASNVKFLALNNVEVIAPEVVDSIDLNANAPAFHFTTGIDVDQSSVQGLRQSGYPVSINSAGEETPLFNYSGRTQVISDSLYLGSARDDLSTVTDTSLEGFSYQDGRMTAIARNGGTVLLLRRNTNSGFILALQSGTTNVGSITTNGTSASFNTTSDARLKDDNGLLSRDEALAILRQIKVHNFTWNEKTGRAGKADIGAFAQELHKVYPRAVHVGSDTENWQIDYPSLIPLLIAALADEPAGAGGL